tara:strand:+ start:50930 stop:51586 length:657 start_codon:yes stop_codon:yes gene_type:complete
MRISYGLYGASGFGSEVMPLVIEQYNSLKTDKQFLDYFFIDDNKQGSDLNGIKIISEEEFCSFKHDKFFNISIADPKIRQKISEKMQKKGCKPFDIRSQHSRIIGDIKIGEGSILTDFSIVTSNVVIGKFFHSNLFSYIAHNCHVGDYVTLAPGVKVNGNIHIEDHVFIGTGAIIKQGIPEKPRLIGKGAKIGMGAVVTRDVESGATVVGNPARILEE